ncbi:MAG: PEP-CTERM sorting domain-containing protein [Phycisphaerae bacterium]|nr:PEP-CTERM sorting domain-containing protein [Phycisphaerae bacterium]MDD5381958.1 PEP-CTERM sorting domain-containing protein [Phycisphaerae bacterium]
MRNVKGVTVRNLLAGVVFVLLFSFPSSATTLHVDKMDLSFMGTEPWYRYADGAGHIDFNPDTISLASLYVFDYTGSYASILGKLEFLPNLERDVSSTTRAAGYFEGSVTVRITGGIRKGTTWVYGGIGTSAKQILEATLVPLYEDPLATGEDRWFFQETLGEEGRFDKTLFLDFVPGSIGVASGILLSNGDTLVMTGPKMDLSLKTASANNFVTGDFAHSGISNIKFTGIPEPASLLLLVGGTLFIRKKIR